MIRKKNTELEEAKKRLTKRTVPLNLTHWSIGEGYSQVQTGNFNNYFQDKEETGEDNNCIVVGDKISMRLKTKYDPKTFNTSDFAQDQQNEMRKKGYPETFTIPMKSGKVVSEKAFHYGIFEITARVPNVKYMWCAIWLTGSETWPPEIDIAEFYNNGHIQFRSSNKIIAKPNLHFKNKNGKHKSLNPIQRYVKHPDERFVKYTLWWEKDFIKIYYDNKLVFECTDQEILKQFNQPMLLILNNAVEWGTNPTNQEIQRLCGEDRFIILSVKVWQ